MFEIIRFSVDKKNEHRVYTWVNFWLLLSGVIHVSTDRFHLSLIAKAVKKLKIFGARFQSSAGSSSISASIAASRL